jgi:excisionase family DNA binding protein
MMFNAEIIVRLNGQDFSIEALIAKLSEGIHHGSELRQNMDKPRMSTQESVIPQQAQSTPVRAVSKKEAARLLGLSVRTIDHYVALKMIRVIRVGKRVLVPTTSIDSVLRTGLGRRTLPNSHSIRN